MKKYDARVQLFDSFIKGLKALFMLPFKNTLKSYKNENQELKKEFLDLKMAEIQELIRLGGPSRFKQAVIEADKLFDLALKSKHARGENMGMRLKNSQNKFNWQTYQGIWEAHKLRNQIVHETNFEVYNYQAQDAVNKFKKGLEELGVL